MITLYKTHGIRKLKSAWQTLEQSPHVTPFLYYDYMKNVTWNSWLKLSVPVFFYGKDEKGKVVFIAPMKYGLLNKKYDTLGNFGYCDITDFLFDDSLYEDEKNSILQQMIDKIGQSFFISRILTSSETLSLLGSKVEQKSIHPCVNIHLPEDYDSHIASLSKSVRQNIRTAYNRMTKNDVSYEFKFFVGGGNIPNEVRKDTHAIYNRRQFSRYRHFKITPYSLLLLCETMKYVIPNTSIRNIDLCRGTEQYKIDMGG